MTTPDRPTVVHAAPLVGEGLTPCCHKPPFDLPRTDRITTDRQRVTCWTGDDPRLVPDREG